MPAGKRKSNLLRALVSCLLKACQNSGVALASVMTPLPGLGRFSLLALLIHQQQSPATMTHTAYVPFQTAQLGSAACSVLSSLGYKPFAHPFYVTGIVHGIPFH